MKEFNPNYLDFEQPLLEIEGKIKQIKNDPEKTAKADAKITKLDKEHSELTRKIFGNLTDWQISQLARHPLRPYTLDYIPNLFSSFTELHGDRMFGDDAALICGIGKIDKHVFIQPTDATTGSFIFLHSFLYGWFFLVSIREVSNTSLYFGVLHPSLNLTATTTTSQAGSAASSHRRMLLNSFWHDNKEEEGNEEKEGRYLTSSAPSSASSSASSSGSSSSHVGPTKEVPGKAKITET
jgi:hypothetical protein